MGQVGHAFGVVLGCYEGEDVDEGGCEGGAGFLGGRRVAEEEGDGVGVVEVGCGVGVVDGKAEEGGGCGIGGGGGHAGVVWLFVRRVRVESVLRMLWED